MRKSYCTIADVLSVAPEFKTDIENASGSGGTEYQPNTGSITQDDMEMLISEASEMVRMMLIPRYNTTVIDTYTQVPPVLIYLSKTYTAMLMYERYNRVGGEYGRDRVLALSRAFDSYREIITGGALRDADGTRITTVHGIGVQNGADNTTYLTGGKLETLYQSEREY